MASPKRFPDRDEIAVRSAPRRSSFAGLVD